MGRPFEMGRTAFDKKVKSLELPAEEGAREFLRLQLSDLRRRITEADEEDPNLPLERPGLVKSLYGVLLLKELLEKGNVDTAAFAKGLIKKYRGAFHQEKFLEAYQQVWALVSPDVYQGDTL